MSTGAGTPTAFHNKAQGKLAQRAPPWVGRGKTMNPARVPQTGLPCRTPSPAKRRVPIVRGEGRPHRGCVGRRDAVGEPLQGSIFAHHVTQGGARFASLPWASLWDAVGVCATNATQQP